MSVEFDPDNPTTDQETILTYLAQSCADIAQIAGMTPDEVWEKQFDGRSITINIHDNGDGTQKRTIEFGERVGPDDQVEYAVVFS